MTPFSALYYLRYNLKRTISLILLLALTAISYIGFLFVNTFPNELSLIDDYMNDVAYIVPYSRNSEYLDVETAIKEIENLEEVSGVYPIESISFDFKSTMNLSLDMLYPVFISENDAKAYNDIIKYIPEDSLPKYGEFLMSSRMAKNLEYKNGDKIKNKGKASFSFNTELTVKIYDSDEYFGFGVDKESSEGYFFMAVRNSGDRQETSQKFDIAMSEFSQKNEGKGLIINTYSSFMDSEILQHAVDMIMLIYMGVIVFVILILIFALNAIFSAVYERRRYEFSVYKAIGMSRRETALKIIKEILVMDIIGLFVGLAVIMIVIFIVNTTYLNGVGLCMPYLSAEAAIITLISNILVIFPIILLKITKMKKYDITEF